MLVDRFASLLGQCNAAQDQLVVTQEGARRMPSHSAARAAIFGGTKARETRLGCAAAEAMAGVEQLQAISYGNREAVLTARASLAPCPCALSGHSVGA